MDPPVNQPGFNLYADQGPQLIGSMIALIILSTTFVSLRLLSRTIAHAGYWWDDILIVVALLIALAPPALNIYAVKHTGFGKHIYRLSDDDDEARQADVTATRLMLWTFQIFFVLATGTIKLCILTFYRRIFTSTSVFFRNMLFGMGAVVGSFTLGVLVLTIFQCTPIHKFWDAGQPGHCIDPLTNLLITGSLNTVLDVIIVLLPVPLLWQLRTTVQQKGVLTAIFLSAGFVCVVSMIRLVVFSKVNMEDVTWNSTAVTLWSAVEPCAGIVCACVPSLRPLLTITFRTLLHVRLPTSMVAAADAKSSRPDSGASTMPWIRQDVESGIPPDESKRNRMEGKGSCVFNTLCTVPSAMRRAQEKPCAVDGETQIKVEEVERPCGGIKVKTEIRWSVQERYDYDDRLY